MRAASKNNGGKGVIWPDDETKNPSTSSPPPPEQPPSKFEGVDQSSSTIHGHALSETTSLPPSLKSSKSVGEGIMRLKTALPSLNPQNDKQQLPFSHPVNVERRAAVMQRKFETTVESVEEDTYNGTLEELKEELEWLVEETYNGKLAALKQELKGLVEDTTYNGTLAEFKQELKGILENMEDSSESSDEGNHFNISLLKQTIANREKEGAIETAKTEKKGSRKNDRRDGAAIDDIEEGLQGMHANMLEAKKQVRLGVDATNTNIIDWSLTAFQAIIATFLSMTPMLLASLLLSSVAICCVMYMNYMEWGLTPTDSATAFCLDDVSIVGNQTAVNICVLEKLDSPLPHDWDMFAFARGKQTRVGGCQITAFGLSAVMVWLFKVINHMTFLEYILCMLPGWILILGVMYVNYAAGGGNMSAKLHLLLGLIGCGICLALFIDRSYYIPKPDVEIAGLLAMDRRDGGEGHELTLRQRTVKERLIKCFKSGKN